MAVVFALKISKDKEWLSIGSLIVESDSKIALACIKSSYVWHLGFFGNKLKNLLIILTNVSLSTRIRTKTISWLALPKRAQPMDKMVLPIVA